ncbi:hypothetical protein [Ruegeria marina]|uniref:Uncharacterized protein n=1 Tax=Ruegeria marina TaxID=639004 RepID=A0A1G6Z9F0_9RHOB|nr:hypothetical protein [Ruegeria marina]SDD98913.1 hypothetical protein SAMN04488239_112128 [Ruegeria marina]
MELLIDALLDWIGKNSNYTIENIPHPIVRQLSPHELTREYYGNVAHLMPDDGVDERINALFAQTDGPNGTIYIIAAEHVEGAAEFDHPTDNPLFREILLHELVHHVQWQTGVSANWDCLALGEPEAYQLGGRYLKQTGTTDPLPNRNFWARIYARC